MLLCADAARELMHAPATFPKPPMTRALLREAAGAAGLLLAEGAAHARLRRALAPTFHARRAPAFAAPMLRHARALAARWAAAAAAAASPSAPAHAPAATPDSCELDVYADVSRCSMRVIGELCLGEGDYDGGSGEDALLEAYRAFLERHTNMSHAALIVTMLAPTLARYAPLREIRDARRLLASIRRRVEETVTRRRALHAAHAADGRPPPERHFLDGFLSAKVIGGGAAGEQKGGDRLSAEEVVDNALTFMAAGHATTSAATCWLLFHLATHPAAQAELRRELVGAFPEGMRGSDSGCHGSVKGVGGGEAVGDGECCCRAGAATAEKLDALPLLDATVIESLRLAPGVNMTARIAEKDVHVAGVLIPRGTIVSIPMQALQRDPGVWGADASAFRPARWSKGAGGAVPAAASWMPFLAGSRACAGRRVALLEMKTVAAAVLLEGLVLRIAPGCEPAASGVILVPAGLRLSFRLSDEGG